MEITSPAFSNHQPVPLQNTCKGQNESPPLEFADVPEETESFVLIVEDLDAPNHWIHWLVYNIPGHIRYFEEGQIPPGSIDGICNGGTHGYEGPCPAYFSGIHHYAFKLYALDCKLDVPLSADKNMVMDNIGHHILGSAELIGVAMGDLQNHSVGVSSTSESEKNDKI